MAIDLTARHSLIRRWSESDVEVFFAQLALDLGSNRANEIFSGLRDHAKPHQLSREALNHWYTEALRLFSDLPLKGKVKITEAWANANQAEANRIIVDHIIN